MPLKKIATEQKFPQIKKEEDVRDIKFWVILVTENSTKLHKLVLECRNELGHNLLKSSHLGRWAKGLLVSHTSQVFPCFFIKKTNKQKKFPYI